MLADTLDWKTCAFVGGKVDGSKYITTQLHCKPSTTQLVESRFQLCGKLMGRPIAINRATHELSVQLRGTAEVASDSFSDFYL